MSHAEILTRRSDWIAEMLRLRGDVENGEPIVFVAVICDNCGAHLSAPTIEALLPLVERWFVNPEIGGKDFCPGCQS